MGARPLVGRQVGYGEFFMVKARRGSNDREANEGKPAAAEGFPASVPSDLAFEEILDRLGRTVDELEGGELPLEKAMLIFEEGVKLSRLGARRLDEAERRIELLLSTEDEAKTRPLTDEERE